nr:MAG: ORF1 [Torque teno midi virus]UHK03791.1 MAG: ORF1 [Torque teno midi virus]UHK03798.1 MAG: ORF1 [Torque teno midi virus]
MPYYFRRYRRRYPWRRRRPRYFRPYRYRRPRRTFRRRLRRKFYRRRVRKKKTLSLKLWQPPYIKKCKIKGQLQAVICGQGRQQFNYIQHRDDIVPAKMPGGGSFSVMVFNLTFLWQEHQLWKNIWTATNQNYDLCRYTGLTIKVYRPVNVDVIVMVNRSFPMLINSGTFPSTHPQRMLMAPKKYIILSQNNAKKGKLYKKIRIKPPHLITNRWFMTKDFAKTNLCMIQLCTCDLTRPYCSISGDNNCTGFNALNTDIFQNVSWQHTITTFYVQKDKKLVGKASDGKWYTLNPQQPYGEKNMFYSGYLLGKQKVMLVDKNQNITEGQSTDPTGTDKTGELLVYCRYNPTPDNGDPNLAYLLTMFRQEGLQPSTTEAFGLQGLPAWLLLYGFFDWMAKLHQNYDIFANYVLILQCPFIATIPKLTYRGSGPTECKYPPIIPVGASFILGRGLSDTDPPPLETTHWYPKVSNQQTASNAIVNTGPFIPKPNKEFSWCVHMDYTAYFKWGGSHHPSQEVQNPASKPDYPIPNQQLKGVQITDPRKIRELHPWEWRRDQLTNKALKRMLQDTDASTDSESLTETPKKKTKTASDPKAYDENLSNIQSSSSSGTSSSETSEEEEETILQQQLHKQRKKQQRLKRYLYHSLKRLQTKQRMLSILTGPTE